MKTTRTMLLVFSLLLMGVAAVVYAAPTSPDGVEIGTPERRNESAPGVTVQAQAGNVTQLIINATRVTTRWQGYFGNLSGTVTLDDGSNNTLYNWELASPTGEVYASNGSTVTWTNIDCFNISSGAGANHSGMNITTLENMIGAGVSDVDGVDETFNESYQGSLDVGGINVNTGGNLCSLTHLFVSDAYQVGSFNETILTDNSSVIWTSIINQDQTGFDGNVWDFQMIVGEDGDVAAASNYYLFVELT